MPEEELEWSDYRDVLTRRRWLLLGALFAVAIAAALGAWLWPVRYESRSLVLVEPQAVPKQYVQPNVSTRPSERLAAIRQQVLSRTRLESLIARYHLYAGGTPDAAANRRVARMRRAIDVVPVKTPGGGPLTAFRIEFRYADARMAQQVTSDLTSQFINDSLEARTRASQATTNFLTAQLAHAENQMNAAQAQLARFKEQYLAELPSEQQSNLAILGNLQAQLYAETNARDRAGQQRIYLESLEGTYRAAARPAANGSAPEETAALDGAIARLEEKLAALEARYTPDYPDVVRARAQLARWKAMRSKEAAASGAEAASPAAAAPAAASLDLAQTQSRLKATRAEIRFHTAQIAVLRRRIAETEARLRLAPLRQQKLDELTRDDQDARQNYQSLLAKKIQSQLATSLEMREQGERLRVIDPASLPERPASPNRLEIVLAGWAAGLAVGIGLVAAGEIADPRVRGAFDVEGALSCPVLVHLPMLRSPAAERRRRWRIAGETTAMVLLACASAALSVYVCRGI
jgi:polysaccharide chain length determinant protein (PEP-CTERM system associated)